ncbi:MAG: YdiU family protein [Candidatus Margulisiibacteriota bacterium]
MIDYTRHCGFNFDNSYLRLPSALYSQCMPSSVCAPELVILNDELAQSMALNFSILAQQDLAMLFSGNHCPQGAVPFSQAYAGHQFGHFTMLGDGRAHILGEHLTKAGDRFDIQFKGSGVTPYSRRGDGRATLGPMLREYIISEAMFALGIPTTRSLAVVLTGEDVIREASLPGAILTRVASSHIRVGTFEYAAAKNDVALVNTLMTYALNRHFPNIKESSNIAVAFFRTVMSSQIDLIVNWMRVGFIHGVMNTDNMSISGETIDYGPCAFMNVYNPNTVYSSIDHMGRYAYANQATIAQWNLARLAEVLLPLFDKNIDNSIQFAQEILADFSELFQQKWTQMMASKLGLFKLESGDAQLISDLLDWMKKNNADYTNTFRDLSQIEKPNKNQYHSKEFSKWFERWQVRRHQNKQNLKLSTRLMVQNNPAIIPRNHIVERVLNSAIQGDYIPLFDFLAVLKFPYKDCPQSMYLMPPVPDEDVRQTFCGT